MLPFSGLPLGTPAPDADPKKTNPGELHRRGVVSYTWALGLEDPKNTSLVPLGACDTFEGVAKSMSMVFRFLAYITVIGYFSGSCFSQIPQSLSETTNTGLGGTSFIVGTVFSPLGSPITRRIRIRLSSPTREIVATTDEDGKFIFSGIVNGSYSVIIDSEQDFQPVNYQVDVNTQVRDPQYFTLTIRLVERREKSAKPGVVSSDLAEAPKSAVANYRKALELSGAGNYKGAIKMLKVALDEYPSFVMALNEMAVQLIKLNELTQAEEVLKRALSIRPDAYEAKVNHSIVLFRLERFAEAEVHLRAIVSEKKESTVAQYYLGRALIKLNRHDEAEGHFYQALATPGSEMLESHRMLANVFIARGDYQRAIVSLETYLRVVPKAPDAQNLVKIISQLKQGIKNSSDND
ncbi:hypothetical protein BH20ACI2_BH20ACI2_14870 [soil metagenome]